MDGTCDTLAANTSSPMALTPNDSLAQPYH